MIKVLFLIPDLSGGGAEKVLCNLVNSMDQTQFDITVQTVNEYNPNNYLAEGIHYKSIIQCKTKMGKKIMNYWYRFCTEFKLTYPLYIKDDFDIEVAFLECGVTKVLAASTNKKAVKLAWVHCDLKKKGLTSKKVGKYYSQYDKVVCVSKEAQRSFEQIFGEYVKSVVLYNVVDEQTIHQMAADKPIIDWEEDKVHLLTVGRLSYEKGCDRLIEASELLLRDGYNIQIHFLGDGDEKNHLEELVDNKKLSEIVKFEGYTNNPFPYMKRANLIVIPSRTEALSTVAIESLILGKIVITTPCAGMQELFGDSQWGLIVEDSVKGIYKGIKFIIDSPKKYKEYECLAKIRGSEFVKLELVHKIENFLKTELNKYNEICQENSN